MVDSMVKKTLKIILVVTAIILVTGCDSDDSNDWKQHSDVEWLNKKMPILSPIIKAQWETSVDSGFIGPSNYTWRGFVLIDSKVKEKILSDYKWDLIDNPPIECSFDYRLHWDCDIWYSSDNFNSKSLRYNWYGDYFFCPEKNILYFVSGN